MRLKKQLLTFIFLSVFFIPTFAVAEENVSQELTVAEATIATAITNLTPFGVSETFPAMVGKLYAFSKITGAKEKRPIKHLWFYGERLMAEAKLNVNSSSWRTYSSKIILPGWKGNWRVDITSEDGLVLHSLKFTIE